MKVYYPFVNFKSRSKEGETYTVNLYPPGEISCTCGAWKYYRNKEGNNGNCIHTKAVKKLFSFEWQYNGTPYYPTELRIEYDPSGTEYKGTFNAVVTYTVELLSSLEISIVSFMGEETMLNSVFSRLAKEMVKSKSVQLKTLKNKLKDNDFSSYRQDIIEKFGVPGFIIRVTEPTEEIGWEYISPFKEIKQLLKRGTSFSPEKIDVIMNYITTDYIDISTTTEASVFDYKKSRNVLLLPKNS